MNLCKISVHNMMRYNTFSTMLFLSITAAANPLIQQTTGTFSYNNNVTILGSAFGSNALSLEWVGDAIEAGSTGSDFAKAGWFNHWGFENAKYATDQKHSNSKSLKCVPLPSTSWNCAFSYKLPLPVTAGQSLYTTWWVRKDSASNTGQWKMLRLSGKETIVDGPQELVFFNWPNQQYQVVVDPGTPNDQSLWLPANVFPAGDNKWYRMELTVKASATGQNDGSIVLSRYDGSAFNSYSTSVKTHVNSSDTYSHVIFQNYEGNGMSSSAIWIDDVLIQKGTPARVELCNNSVWSARTHCEIQVPISWSNESLSIKFQPGSFSAGQAAYLYVIDSNGNASNAAPITINNSSSVLSPPSNLKLN